MTTLRGGDPNMSLRSGFSGSFTDGGAAANDPVLFLNIDRLL